MLMSSLRGLLVAFLLLVCFVRNIFAGTFTNIVAFGDSLTDVGNLWGATFHTNPSDPPYWQGRSSNGKVWVEYLGPMYGLPAPTASYPAGGSDYAWRGGGTGTSSLPPGALLQVSQYLGAVSNKADPGALYIVWAGANDVFSDPANFNAASSAQNVATAVQTLYSAGSRTFLVPNMPPLEKTPDALVNPADAALFGPAAKAFNQYLAADLAGIRASDPGISFLDLNLKNVDPKIGDVIGTYDCFNYLVAHPHNSPYWDFQNVTDEGMLDPVNGSNYLFWDDVHPTTATHELLAAAVVPEPGTLALLGALICGMAVYGRIRLRSAA